MASPSTTTALPVTYDDVVAAAARLDGVAHRTPILTSRTVDERVGASVFFKAENFQRVGAFKFRGGYNALAALSPEERQRGVVAYSSGNHAQAIALASQLLDIPAKIIMPEDAPAVKLAATRGYGAEVVLYNRFETSREAMADEIVAREGRVLIPSFDHPDVIAGQGTAAKELFEDVGPLDALLVCVGGGGFLSGSALAARALAPDCRVIGVEPDAGDDAARSFHTGTLQAVRNPDTIADGARTASLGTLTFPLVLHLADDMVTVSDDALIRAMRVLWERMKVVVEPTGALATAALLEGTVAMPGARIGVMISGGNVDVAKAAQWFAEA